MLKKISKIFILNKKLKADINNIIETINEFKFSEGTDFPDVENVSDEFRAHFLDPTKVNLVGCDPGKRSLVYLVDDKGTKL